MSYTSVSLYSFCFGIILRDRLIREQSSENCPADELLADWVNTIMVNRVSVKISSKASILKFVQFDP